jgi:enterochelin esterase family protein
VTLAILDLLHAHENLDESAVDAFLAKHDSPLVEGSTITFLYRGHADEVLLRHFIYGLSTAQEFRQLRGTTLWYCSLEVPPGSRIEYKIEVVEGRNRRLIRDPLNPHTARDPFGANSVCHGAGYEVPEWTHHDPEARPGTLEDLTVPGGALGAARPVKLWLPPRMRPTRRYPLLVVFDGLDYLKYASMATVLENLVYRNEIAPMVVAFCQSPDRMVEYAADPRHARWVVEDLIPLLEHRFPLREARERALMGASLGAVASLHAAWLHQGSIGRLLLQSGSFAFTDIGREVRSPVLEPVREFINAFRTNPGKPARRLFVSCGVYERLIYENRSLVPVLQRTGMQVRYEEARDGHNWENWRDRLRDGLTWLFPGPLALVYE